MKKYNTSPVCYDKEDLFTHFREIYGIMPIGEEFAPYRICPLGAHSDHQLGKITGFAIDKGIHIAYTPDTSGQFHARSLQFSAAAEWSLSEIPARKVGDWADYLRGATLILSGKYRLSCGLSILIDGELPIGGLSSSASVVIAFLEALCAANEITLAPAELIAISKETENSYVGVASGKLDQSCEVYAKAGHLLYMDLLDDSYETIPEAPSMKPFEIAVFFSGIERTLAGSKFNMRVDECRSAAYALKAFAGIPYGKFEETNLREIPYKTYLEYKDALPVNFAKRAEHWYSEFARVEAAAEAFRRGDIETFGRLSFESGRSSIVNWETGSPELAALYEIMTETDGIYGGRFSGAGFKGCCMAIIDPARRDEILESVECKYVTAFPHLAEKYSAHICQSADGVAMSHMKDTKEGEKR